MPAGRLHGVEADDVIPYGMESMRFERARNVELQHFAALEFAPGSRGWARASSLAGRRKQTGGRAGRTLAFVAYFLRRYAFHGSQ